MQTYILGAGASREIGYPLAADMGSQLLEFMLGSNQGLIRSAGEVLEDTFGRSPNVEDLITQLQSRIASLKDAMSSEGRAERMRLGNAKGWLGVGLQEWFKTIHTAEASSYRVFASEIVRRGDVVITFNYDDSLERELKRAGKWDVSRGYGFPLGSAEHASDVLVLKLHGSMNWLVSILGGATGGTFLVNPDSSLGNHPVVHRADLEFLGYSEFEGHVYHSGGAFPCLVLPGRNKEFFYDTSFGPEYAQFWDSLWLQAGSALAKSERVTICGYSLLPVDARACDLILRRTRKETVIEVVSASQTPRIAQMFREAGFGTVKEFSGGYFRQWCEAITTQNAAK